MTQYQGIRALQRAAESRRDIEAGFRNRVLTDLAFGGTSAKLSSIFPEWPALNFKAFHEEVQKQFKRPIPFVDRDAWQQRFNEDKARVIALTAEIDDCERKIDDAVYGLFKLTPDEIALIESDLQRVRSGAAASIDQAQVR